MKRLFRVFIIILLFTVVSSCSDNENRFGLPLKTATVTINLGMPGENPSISGNTIWKTIRSVFITDAFAQTAPAAFSSVDVTVTAPGMTTVQQTFSGSGAITIPVPAGSARQFEVIANVAPGDPSAALSFRGITTADLTAATMSVPVAMSLNETKIVIPDAYNYRVVTIDNFSITHWNPITSLSGVTTLFPYDISYDSRGRIYIANNSTQGVIRVDNSNGSNVKIFSPSPSNVLTIAVDRKNNIVYYATSTALYKNTLDGTNQLSLTSFAPIYYINGIEVNTNGMLFIVGTNLSGTAYVILYNPNANSGSGAMLTQYGPGNLSQPWDVINYPPNIYVANLNGGPNYKIIQFTLDSSNNFVPAGNYGVSGTTTAKGVFYGPNRFLAIRNDSLVILDNGGTTDRKLISMDDITGTNWMTYGTAGIGVDAFKFYSVC